MIMRNITSFEGNITGDTLSLLGFSLLHQLHGVVEYSLLVCLQGHDALEMGEANGVQDLNDYFVSIAV